MMNFQTKRAVLYRLYAAARI